MKKTIRIISAIALVFLLLSFSREKELATAREPATGLHLLLSMLDSIKKIQTLSFHLKALERVEGKFLAADSDISLSLNPKMIYFRNEKKKISILWKEGQNNGNALVKAKLTLNATVSLDPYGNMMRKNQHYTIHELGFNFFARTISSALLKHKDKLLRKISYSGKKSFHDRLCHIIVFDDEEYGYFSYKAAKNESVSSIAIRFNVSDYVIRMKNSLNSFYGTIKEGTELQVPNSYCKKVVLCLDEKTLLPVNITNYDDAGLYENYEYSAVTVNKALKTLDFTQFYKD